MRINLDHVASGHFALGGDVLCEFDYWPLAVSMPPTKVCPSLVPRLISSFLYKKEPGYEARYARSVKMLYL